MATRKRGQVIPAEAVEAAAKALWELWPNNHCSYDDLSDWAQEFVDRIIKTEGEK